MLPVLLVIFLAVFIQTLTSFGSGLVAMAFLPAILGVRTATPLVVLVTCTLELVLLVRLRANFNFKAVWRLALAAWLGIPPVSINKLKQCCDCHLLLVTIT